MNPQFQLVTPAQVIRVVFDRSYECGLRLEGSLASASTLAPIIPLFPGCSFRRPASRRAARAQN
jgi:hypothetical protein